MISSIIIKSDMETLNYVKVEIDIIENTLKTSIVKYEINDELREHVVNKHRAYLPCTISFDEDMVYMPVSVVMYVPEFWGNEMIENYTQAFLDEIYLYNRGIEGAKTLKQIEQSFILEVILL